MNAIAYEDDIENISRELLYDDVEKKEISLKNICKSVIYVFAGSTIIIIVIVTLITVLRQIKN